MVGCLSVRVLIVARIYGYTIQAERIKYLEMRVGDLELLVSKLDTLDNVKDQRFIDIMTKLTEMGVK